MSTQSNENTTTINHEEEVMKLVEQIGWEGVLAKLSTNQSNSTGTKMDRAVVIFQEMTGKERKYVIKAFMEQLDMGKEGAATYYQTIKTRLATKKLAETTEKTEEVSE